MFASPVHRRRSSDELMLGLLSLGPTAVVSHEAAARLHGFDRCIADAVEFSVPRDRPRPRGAVPRPLDERRFRRSTASRSPASAARRRRARSSTSPGLASRRSGWRRRSTRRSGRAPLRQLVLAARPAELRGPGRWGSAAARRAAARQRRPHDPRATLPAADAPMRAAEPTTQVVHRRDGRTFARVDFLFEDLGGRRRGVGSQGSRVRRRTSPGRPATQRAPGRSAAGSSSSPSAGDATSRSTSCAPGAPPRLGHRFGGAWPIR